MQDELYQSIHGYSYADFRCRITNYTAPNIDIVKILEGIYDPEFNKEVPYEYNSYMVNGYRIFHNEDLGSVCDEEVKKLMYEVVYDQVKQYCMSEFALSVGNNMSTEKDATLPPISIEMEEYWVTVMPPGSYQRIHSHPPNNLSGTIILQAPEGSGDLYIPSPYINGIENIIATHKEYIMFPRARQGLLYPSSLPHYVSRNESDDDRVSISYNLKLKNI